MALASGTTVADRFKLVRPLGKGGMGSVWVAQHIGLDVACAVKFIHGEGAQAADVRARFELEAKAAAQLRGANVVQILDHGVWEEMPYIAMELLEGEDLDRRLRRQKTLEPRELCAIFAQVARGLGKAHALGLVHRDLKPANIFLARDDENEVVKILDFGVAKATMVDHVDGGTKTGSLIGTPQYMSPEQARGERTIDPRSDLWSLGVIAYRCVVGVQPFRGEALFEVLTKICVDPVPVPSAVAQVPPGFDAWWAKAAARDPNERFQSARDLAESLAVALEVASPTSTGTREWWNTSQSGRKTGGQALEVPAASRPSLASSATKQGRLSDRARAVATALGVAAAVVAVGGLVAIYSGGGSPHNQAPRASTALGASGRDGAPGSGSPNPSDGDLPVTAPPATTPPTSQANVPPAASSVNGPSVAPHHREGALRPPATHSAAPAPPPSPPPAATPSAKPEAAPPPPKPARQDTDYGI